ncbi:hypothetical protein EQY69_09845 [Clostridium perfringens]|nr:hypothetical protein [Clostridium perfringens]
MDKKIYGVIYLIRNNANNKIYIGQTTDKRGFKGRYDRSGNSIEKVYKYHLSYKKSNSHYNKHLLSSIEKYGFNTFYVDIKFDIAYSQQELNKLEDMYIKIYNSNNQKYGYNHRNGGNNGKLTDETKRKISISMKGENNPFYGKTHSEEIKNILSNHRKGNKLSKETKQKIKKANTRGNHPDAIKVICITTNKIFDCINDGANYYSCDSSSILKCCSGKRKSCGKLNNKPLIWMFYNEYINKNKEDIKNLMSQKTGREIINKSVICLNDNKFFNSIKEASEYYDIFATNISAVCKGKIKSIKGYKFKYYKL